MQVFWFQKDVGVASNQQQESSDSKTNLLKLKNIIFQNSKMVKTEKFYKLGPKCCPPTNFGEGKPEELEVMAHG